MSSEFTQADAKAGACAYILHTLLQRLETSNPGLVGGMLRGVEADQAAMKTHGAVAEPVRQIVQEALLILRQVHAQNRSMS